MWRACLVSLAACGFNHGQAPDDATIDTAPRRCTRFPIDTGGAPASYTLRVDATTALAIGDPVRVVSGTTELDRLLDPPFITFRMPASGPVWLYVEPDAIPKADASNVYLFAESFESIALGSNADGPFVPDPPNEWTVIDDGGNRVYHAGGIARHPAAIRGLMVDNAEISARMRIGMGGGENHNGLTVRSNSLAASSMDGFVAQLQENVQRIRLGEYVNGNSPAELAGIDRTVARMTWYALRLRIVGDALSFYVDDQLVVSASKTGADGMLLGLFAYNSVVDYDDVRVRLAMNPEPVAALGSGERCD